MADGFGADGTVGVKQAGTPDRLIDNAELTVGAQTVYRQRVIAYTPTLTARMFARQPYDDTYRIWLDTADTSYIYIAEALSTAVSTDAGAFRGVRVPKDSSGNPLGKVEVNTGFKWSDKSGGTWS